MQPERPGAAEGSGVAERFDAAVYPPAWIHQLIWRGWRVSYLAASSLSSAAANPVVLIHGFGACKEHWRHNVQALRQAHDVYAIDLIGFGGSDQPRSCLRGEAIQPGSVRYGMSLWADQVVDFIHSQGLHGVHLVGNSIGGVVALAASRQLEERGAPAAGVVLIDCAQRALDDKRLKDQPPLARRLRPWLKRIIRQRWLTDRLFRSFATATMVRRVLLQAYPSGRNVDAQLVELLLEPTKKPGASEAFRGFINLFDDVLAPDLLADLSTPVTLIAGTEDPWEPIEEARSWKQYPCVTGFFELPGCGHCPHDEDPEACNPILLSTFAAMVAAKDRGDHRT